MDSSEQLDFSVNGMGKLPIAILGTGNIGTDLLVKVLRSSVLECRLFAGRNLASPGMTKASALNVPLSSRGIQAILERRREISLVFDATSAEEHVKHAPLLESAGIIAVDLTPAKIGEMCVPAVNLEACLGLINVNMVTCGGQASIPLAAAIARACQGVEYIETVSSIASRSAGPATRVNLDEYLNTTEIGIEKFTKCRMTKAILNLNPAQPCVHMQTTVMAKCESLDIAEVRSQVVRAVDAIQRYVPGYRLIVEPIFENNRLITMVKVDGLGDYLPRYAGNLDIINCAAVAYAEAVAHKDSN
jgi:acetaldehyde dehydrogenase (acetylating)